MNSQAKPTLKLDWGSHAAAKYAVEHWHYSKSLPGADSVKVGVWEDGDFIGCIFFSRGSNNNMGKPYGLPQTEICELTRIALNTHSAPVSKIASVALRMMKAHCSGLRMVLSYADPKEGHHGGIYQAMNWVYVGRSQPQRELVVAGKFMHKRSATSKYGTASPDKIKAMTGLVVEYGPIEWKHTYLMPLDKAMKAQIEPLRKPYPKRATSIDSDAPVIHTGESGANPTVALDGS